MPRLAPVLLSLAFLAAAPAGAGARVLAVASGKRTVSLLDVRTHALVSRITVGSPATDVAILPDGSRAFVAAGHRIVAIDLGTRRITGYTGVSSEVTGLAVANDGLHLYAARDGEVDHVACGPGDDIVYADQIDVIAGDCESVRY